ncbi:MAG: trypsin-like serine protease [Elusimicrobiaceae bacterium]|nr:trypsin-like serine protease [Elusimicrobiaceae bacterium]
MALIIPRADAVALSDSDGNLDIKSFAKELNISPTIVGEDDRQEITNENAQDLEKAVVILGRSSHNKIHPICSGAMVGPNLVLTAAHCLVENRKYKNNIEVFAVVADKSDNEPLLSAKSIELYVPKEYIELSHNPDSTSDKYDYGVIVLDKPIALKTGWFRLKDRPTPYLKIITMGHPKDKPDDTLWRSEGSTGFWVDDNNTFYHNADILPGNSGGPIVMKKKPDEIIGIHIAHNGVDDYAPDGYPNVGLKITQEIVDLVQTYNRRTGPYLTPKN